MSAPNAHLWPLRDSHNDGGMAADDDDNDDNVSVTSTVVPPNDGDEYTVEDLLAEKRCECGRRKYLVKWEDWPIYHATWEPEEAALHTEILRDTWLRNKAAMQAGMRPTSSEQYQTWERAVEAQASKVTRRNAKRKRLGIPEKPYESPSFMCRCEVEEDAQEDALSERESSVEALEDNAVDQILSNSPARRGEPQRRNAIFKGITAPEPRASHRKSTSTSVSTSPSATKKRRATAGDTSSAALQTSSTTSTGQPGQSKTSTQPQSHQRPPKRIQTATGYQGTARKPSSVTTDSGKTSSIRPSAKTAMKQASASLRSAPGSAAASTATKLRRTMPSAKQSIVQAGSGNVFAGGKSKKPKKSKSVLMGVEVESSKPGRLFPTLSDRRRSELSSRNLENQAPDADQVRSLLFAPQQGPPAVGRVAGPDKTSSARKTSTSDEVIVVEEYTLSGSRGSFADVAKKTRKSVHFGQQNSPERSTLTGENLVQEPEPMDFDDTANPVDDPMVIDDGTDMSVNDEPMPMDIDPPSVASVSADLPPASATTSTHMPSVIGTKRKVSMQEYQAAKLAPRSVLKQVEIGTSKRFKVFFEGIPSDYSYQSQRQSWLNSFLSEEVLPFRHMCLAQLFKSRLGCIRPSGKNLCAGIITSSEEQTTNLLSNVAERQKAAGTGLLLCRPEYALLMYPAKGDDWSSAELGVDLAGTSDLAVLRYIIFDPVDNLGSMLWGPQPPLSDSEHRCDRIGLAREAFGLTTATFKRLVPPTRPGSKAKPRFFLIFPHAVKSESLHLVMWLRACDSGAEIYTWQCEGTWRAFLKDATDEKSKEDPAILIIHDRVFSMARRIPDLKSFLDNNRDHFVWRWPESTPGTVIEPERLFPIGHVYLLTPSFFVSEPRLARKLLDKFCSRERPFSCIMVASNIIEYLKDLEVERKQEQMKILNEKVLSVAERESKATKLGLSMEDCRLRAELIHAVLDWIRDSVEKGLLNKPSFATKILFVDEAIDANDEQSLVNWFGWWSMVNSDEFRRFHVVGTREKSPRLRRSIPVPKYKPDTDNDPDALARKRKMAEELAQVKTQIAEQLREIPRPPAVAPAPVPAPAPATALAAQENITALGHFESKKVADDFPLTLGHYLRKLAKQQVSPGVWRLFSFPIFWKDANESFRHGTLNCTASKDIPGWFKYTWPFKPKSPYMLYAGFFYTVEDGWDPQASQNIKRQAPRRPWVALYRPSFFKRKLDDDGRMPADLFMIDPSTSTPAAAPGVHVLEADLPSAQRALVEQVRNLSATKDQRLNKVWLGRPPPRFIGSPLDQCLCMIEQAILDPLRIIPWDKKEVIKENFHPVLATAPPPPPKEEPPSPPSEVDDMADCKIVFHAPAPSASFTGTSCCINHLYEQMRFWRLRGGLGGRMDYTYRPTLEWYEEQRLEGRGFEHIRVESGDVIAAAYKAGEEKRAEAKRAAEKAKATAATAVASAANAATAANAITAKGAAAKGSEGKA